MSDNQSRFIRNFCRTLTIWNQPDLENWKRKCKQIILEPGGKEKTKAYSSWEEFFTSGTQSILISFSEDLIKDFWIIQNSDKLKLKTSIKIVLLLPSTNEINSC